MFLSEFDVIELQTFNYNLSDDGVVYVLAEIELEENTIINL